MKETPILFTTDMVRAIMREHFPKTHSRRVIKPQPEGGVIDGEEWFEWCHPRSGCIAAESRQELLEKYCPYGRPGDRLWVREAWRTNRIFDHLPPSLIAEDASLWWEADASSSRRLGAKPGRLRPSIHMPKWAARNWLELTEVRVERLTDISPPDALAEGCEGYFCNPCDESGKLDGEPCEYCGGEGKIRPVSHFRQVWNTINAKRGWAWASNPWVWVLVFRRIQHG